MGQRALLVIDLQKGLHGLFQEARVLAEVNQRISVYHAQQLPVIFIQHEDEDLAATSPAWQLFEELTARPEDFYVRKTHANAFFHTTLQPLLDSLSVQTLEFCGAQTEYCVDTSIRMAHGLGYTCLMKKGLSTTVASPLLSAKTIINHHEAIWAGRFLTFI